MDFDKKIKDFKYKKGMGTSELIDQIGQIGFQALNLGRAIEIIKRMKQNKAKIFLSFSSNMTSSGLRGLFAKLAELKFVDVMITTVGSVEEDIIKANNNDFYAGSFSMDDKALAEQGVNRIGNILVKNESYAEFEELMPGMLSKVYEKKKKVTVTELLHELGLLLEDENSILYQASKNNIPVYCPAITDGAFGVHLAEFRKKNPDFDVDVIGDMDKLLKEPSFEKNGVIALGGGVSKHHAIFANMMGNGADYLVYMTTAQPTSGSVSGATTDEAKSWGKLKSDADAVTVIGDVTITFPLVMTKVLEDSGF